mmetsp:Transcript_80827/g.240899  ORF Transcript_80827/g.240899 Transcript_80827/m.240899 type:complete len:84 (+) Transcript_80827:542-793(+)
MRQRTDSPSVLVTASGWATWTSSLMASSIGMVTSAEGTECSSSIGRLRDGYRCLGGAAASPDCDLRERHLPLQAHMAHDHLPR